MLPRITFRLTRPAAVAVAALAVCLLTAGPAAAQTDRDCPDFPDRAAAQAALDSRAGDPERLDADHDGSACEDFPYSTFTGVPPATAAPVPPQVAQVPAGAVEAGDGSAALASRSGTGPTASMAATLDRTGGVAFVAGFALAATLVMAGPAGLAVAGRMLRRIRWHR